MLRTMEEKVIGMKVKGARFLQELMEEERGDSNYVGILLMIVIVVGLAAMFRTQLTTLVTNVFAKITEFMG